MTLSKPAWSIHRATAKHALLIKRLRLAMLEADGLSFDVDPASALHQPLNHWAGWVADDRVVFFAKDRGPIAMVAAHLKDSSLGITAHVGALWVAPSHRFHGIARALLQETSTWASSANATRCVLSVAEWNYLAIALYESLGYALTGEAVKTRHGHAELVMSLQL